MLIFSYRLLQVIFYPIILFIGLIRIFGKKENYLSFKQKIFSIQNYKQISEHDYLIHFASIGELNSITGEFLTSEVFCHSSVFILFKENLY